MRKAEGKFVLYREVGDGYRWRLRSATGQTLAASEAAYPLKSACEADLLAFMDDRHVEAEVLDATAARGARRAPHVPGLWQCRGVRVVERR